MCVYRSVLVTPAARFVVSESGDCLSPAYAPERTAPTVIGAGTPSPAPMPTKATPRVPTVVHEEPMANATTAATTAAAGRNVVGERISSP